MNKSKPDHISQEAWDAVASPPLTDAFLAGMKPRRTRGAQKAPTKQMISLRLDRDVLERLRGTGEGWQRRANDMLRKAIGL